MPEMDLMSDNYILLGKRQKIYVVTYARILYRAYIGILNYHILLAMGR